MGERKVRVAELVKREISSLLHGRWRTEAVSITITEVDVSPDLKKATVYYSVIGGREAVAAAGRFLASVRSKIRYELGHKVILKYTPELNFVHDISVERGMRVIDLLDQIEAEGESAGETGESSDNGGADFQGNEGKDIRQ